MNHQTTQHLIPHLSTLRRQLIDKQRESQDDQEKAFRRSAVLEQLPYALSSGYHAVAGLLSFAESLPQKHEGQLSQESLLGLLGDRDRMSFYVDSFLDITRRAQNAVGYYVSKAKSVQFPGSLSKAYDRTLAKGQELAGDPVDSLTVAYWENHGKQLKAYRDLSQHHAVVCSDATMFLDASGAPCLHFVLPSNPEIKSGGELDYRDSNIHVLPYVWDEYVALLKFVYKVTESLLAEPLGDEREFGIYFKTPLTAFDKYEGHHTLPLADFDREVKDVVGN